MARTNGPPSFGAQEADPSDEAMMALGGHSPRERALARQAETAASALATAARAQVEARYVMALQRPRSWEVVRQKIMDECARPRFAEVARYHKPIGKGVSGPSIRFAEMALRNMANVMPENAIILDDDRRRNIRVTVTDLESNVTYSQDVMVDKTVERRELKEGQEVVSTRVNSYGKTTYLVPATEDDLLNKQNALVSKALRTLALRLLPGDILDEAMEKVISVQKKQDALDPTAARRSCADYFQKVGVSVTQLAEYLGHPFDDVTPEELVDLRAIAASIRDKEARWSDVMEGREVKQPTKTDPKPEVAAAAPAAPVPANDAAPVKAPVESLLKKDTKKAEPPIDPPTPPAPPAKTPEQIEQEREAEEADRAIAAQEKAIAEAAEATPSPPPPAPEPVKPAAKKKAEPPAGFAVPGFVQVEEKKPPREPGVD